MKHMILAVKKKAAACAFLFICFYVFADAAADIDCSHPSLPEGLAAMSSTIAVSVKTIPVDVWPGDKPAPEGDNFYYAFEPRYKAPTIGLIVHPGGNCAPQAYAPMAQAIAKKGYLVAIIPMPNCVSLGGWDRTARVIEDFGEIKTWVLAGHSMGGATICVYAHEYGGIAGLVLLAGLGYPDYPLDTSYNIKVLSLYGENDCRCTPAMVMDPQYKAALPSDTTYVEIPGGNHTQFAWLDSTPQTSYLTGDCPATITHQEQQDIILQYMLEFLASFSNKPLCPVVSLFGKQSKQVISLRQFRDKMLTQSAAGQKLIEYYYLQADTINTIFDNHPALRGSVKKALEFLVPMMDTLFRLE